MQKSSLTTALTNATKLELFRYVDYMRHLHAQFNEFATLMTAIYSSLEILGEFYASVDTERYTKVSLRHIASLYEGRDEDLVAMSDDELGMTQTTSEHFWNVRVSKKTNHFELVYGADDDEDIQDFFEDSGIGGTSDKFRKYPLNEDGYQKLVCDLSVLLSQYLPMDAQLERLRRIDLQTGQQAFKFG